jgi:hypothetical protein
MSRIDLETIKERLRVEGRKSLRMPWLIGKVRRVLWPFVRSYHFLTLEWVRGRLEAADPSDALRTLQDQLTARTDQLAAQLTAQAAQLAAQADRQRALRAEFLALSHENAALRAALDQQAERLAALAASPQGASREP